MRDIAASMRGYYLKTWRYGRDTENLIEEALERENWSSARFRNWQEERLSYILHRAASQVPFYRAHWNKRRAHGDHSSWEVLENWPILKKTTLRENTFAFIADDCDIRRMYRDQTSGTTGTPLSIYLSRKTLHEWYALYEARIRRWHDVSIKERWAILGGQLIVPAAQTKPPYWVHNFSLNQLYLSSQHVSKRNAKWFIKALRDFAPTHMVAYPSSAAILASAIRDEKIEVPSIKVFFSNAETLLPSQSSTISESFQCPVVDTYGLGEYACGASECRNGAMHIWPEVGFIELFDKFIDQLISNGSPGRLIVTGLLNPDMPLIRYDTGDIVNSISSETSCACQRNLPVFNELQGRLRDSLITSNGRFIFWLNPVFYGIPIQEAQIIQDSFDQVRVRYVPTPFFSQTDAKVIIKRLQDRMGSIDVVLESCQEIPREPNGKFRSVICNLSEDERVSIR